MNTILSLGSDTDALEETKGSKSTTIGEETEITLSSDSNASVCTERTSNLGKEMETKSSDPPTVVTARSSILDDILRPCFEQFWWFDGIGTIVDNKEPVGFFFDVRDHREAVENIERIHHFNKKDIGVKRTVFVGGIPRNVGEDDFEAFFSKYGTIVEREIVRDPTTKKSLGYGFIIFDSEKSVDSIVEEAEKNQIQFSGNKINAGKAEITMHVSWLHPDCNLECCDSGHSISDDSSEDSDD